MIRGLWKGFEQLCRFFYTIDLNLMLTRPGRLADIKYLCNCFDLANKTLYNPAFTVAMTRSIIRIVQMNRIFNPGDV
ncbi:hypothetical protein, partial [Thiomicrospira sp.]|uniref:hypothetical protein n=1 Tax=Thiomicrospira sp. TaxID=935 RepID=UPI002F939144